MDGQSKSDVRIKQSKDVYGNQVTQEQEIKAAYGGGVADEYNLTLEERRELGLKDNETWRWARSPDVWSKLESGVSDDVADTLRTYPGSRLIRDKNGRMIHCGSDLVLVAYTKDQRAEIQDNIDKHAEAFVAEDAEMAKAMGLSEEERVEILRAHGSSPESTMTHEQRIDEQRRKRQMGSAAPKSDTYQLTYEQAVEYKISRIISQAEQYGEKVSKSQALEMMVAEREAEARRIVDSYNFNPDNSDYSDMIDTELQRTTGKSYSVNFGTSLRERRQNGGR